MWCLKMSKPELQNITRTKQWNVMTDPAVRPNIVKFSLLHNLEFRAKSFHPNEISFRHWRLQWRFQFTCGHWTAFLSRLNILTAPYFEEVVYINAFR